MRNVVLSVRPAPGVEVRMLNQYPAVRGRQGWRLPDIGTGAEAWALLRLRIARDCVAADIGARIEVTVDAVERSGDAWSIGGSLQSMPVLPAVAYSAVAEHPEVMQRCDEIEASELLLRCRSAP
jgi:hypothetical protein